MVVNIDKTGKMSVLLVEDHALTRFGLKTALESKENIEQIHEAENGEQGIDIAKELKPDIVVMDLGLPGINGIEATKIIKSQDKNIRVVILTSHEDENEVWSALSAGANAYCLKDISPEKLLNVIEFINEGAAWLDPAIADTVLKSIAERKGSANSLSTGSSEQSEENKEEKIQLTDREIDVLKLIVDGYSNAEISEKLFVSIHTTKAHVCNILHKLSVDDRTQAAIKALKDGLV